jgi:hypothetical protein
MFIINSSDGNQAALLQQSRPVPFTEYMATFIIAKTKQVTVFVKIHERAVQSFESSKICAMKEWHKSSGKS